MLHLPLRIHEKTWRSMMLLICPSDSRVYRKHMRAIVAFKLRNETQISCLLTLSEVSLQRFYCLILLSPLSTVLKNHESYVIRDHAPPHVICLLCITFNGFVGALSCTYLSSSPFSETRTSSSSTPYFVYAT